MEELQIRKDYLPDTITDLASWDKYLSVRIPIYRKLLKGVSSIEEATEEEKRILRRAQDEADYLVDIRAAMGRLTIAMPKASGGDRKSEDFKITNVGNFEKSKKQALDEAGISNAQAYRNEAMAEHPEAVERAKAKARENHDIVTQSDVMNEIMAEKTEQLKQKAAKKETEEKEKQEHIRAERQAALPENAVDVATAIEERNREEAKLNAEAVQTEKRLDKLLLNIYEVGDVSEIATAIARYYQTLDHSSYEMFMESFDRATRKLSDLRQAIILEVMKNGEKKESGFPRGRITRVDFSSYE